MRLSGVRARIASPRNCVEGSIMRVRINRGRRTLIRMLASAYSRGRGFGQTDRAVLGRHLGKRSRQAGEAGDRSGIDDRATALACIRGSLCCTRAIRPFKRRRPRRVADDPSQKPLRDPPANKPVTQTIPAVNLLHPLEGEKPLRDLGKVFRGCFGTVEQPP
jgi:hypothetical protein